jgi:hypothetical protein
MEIRQRLEINTDEGHFGLAPRVRLMALAHITREQ